MDAEAALWQAPLLRKGRTPANSCQPRASVSPCCKLQGICVRLIEHVPRNCIQAPRCCLAVLGFDAKTPVKQGRDKRKQT